MTSVSKGVTKHSDLTGVDSGDHHSKYSHSVVASGTTSLNHDAYTTLTSGSFSNRVILNAYLDRDSQSGACTPVYWVNSGTPEFRVREENQGAGTFDWELIQR